MSKSKKMLIVGQSSYIGQNLYLELQQNSRCLICSFDDFFKIDLDNVSIVINCCFDRRLVHTKYETDLDLDLKIARHILETQKDITYVMSSSRAVYKQQANPSLTETDQVIPSSLYGQNKLRIEKELQRIMPRLLILRMSNVFGKQKLDRQTFASFALNSLKKSGVITLDISPHIVKDFVPINFVCKAVEKLLLMGKTGVYNIGSGVGVSVGDFVNTIIQSFGTGKVEQIDLKAGEEFILNIDKLKRTTQLQISKEDVLTSLKEWVEEYK